MSKASFSFFKLCMLVQTLILTLLKHGIRASIIIFDLTSPYVSRPCFKNVFLSSLWTTSKSFPFYNWTEGRHFHLVSWQFRAVWSRPSCSCDFVNKGESARPPQPQTGKGKTRKRTFRSQIMWNQSWNFWMEGRRTILNGKKFSICVIGILLATCQWRGVQRPVPPSQTERGENNSDGCCTEEIKRDWMVSEWGKVRYEIVLWIRF